ncbi:MAG TPA: hypothetical protein VF163_03620 [Micromonosporaceae bacterium]
MWQVGRDFGRVEAQPRAYAAGVARGLDLARDLVDQAVMRALRRPDGHGGPDLDAEAAAEWAELLRRYLYPQSSERKST